MSPRGTTRHPGGPRGGGLPLLVAVAALLLVGLAPGARSGAGASTGETQGDSQRLRLLEQTAWVPPEGGFAARIAVDRPPPGATLRPVLHTPVTTRGAFRESLDGERVGRAYSTGPAVAVDEAATVQQEGWTGTIARDAATQDPVLDLALATRDEGPYDQARTRVADDGVYPLTVELLDADGDTIDQLVTYLVRLPADPAASEALGVSVVVPVHAPVALQPDGTTTLDDGALASLDDVVVALSEHPDVPLTVVPTPETVAALGAIPQADGPVLRDLLADSLEQRQVLAGTYVDLDPTSFVVAGLDEELTSQVTSGADTLGTQLGVRPDGRTWMAGTSTTTETLAELRELGVDQVVIPEAILAPLDDGFRLTLTQSFDVVTSAGTSQRAMAADEALRAHAGSTGDGVLDAHHLLADLAVLHYDRPAEGRGTVAALPAGALPDGFLDALLTGLGSPGIVAPVTLDALFRSTTVAGQGGDGDDDGPPLFRSLEPAPPEPLGSYPTELAEARRQLAGYESLVGLDNPDVAELDRRILASAASGFDGPRRQQYLDAVTTQVAGSASAVSTEQQGVTITERTGTIPVLVHNELDDDVTVTIELASDKLEFPDGTLITETVPPGSTTIDVRVDTRASGAFPVEVEMRSPDGALVLAEDRFTVRSTSVSGLGVVLSVVAALFLLVWWASHFRSVRRASRLVSTAHPAARAQARSSQDRFLDGIGKRSGNPGGRDP